MHWNYLELWCSSPFFGHRHGWCEVKGPHILPSMEMLQIVDQKAAGTKSGLPSSLVVTTKRYTLPAARVGDPVARLQWYKEWKVMNSNEICIYIYYIDHWMILYVCSPKLTPPKKSTCSTWCMFSCQTLVWPFVQGGTRDRKEQNMVIIICPSQTYIGSGSIKKIMGQHSVNYVKSLLTLPSTLSATMLLELPVRSETNGQTRAAHARLARYQSAN